jgi:predicted Zn-dependent peptidase
LEFREFRLPNGLQIIAECNRQAYSTALGFFVNTGSRDETPEIAGISHFLEHMLFKGTPRRSAEDVNRELDELGSHSNAFTSEEHTVYYATVLPEYQRPMLDLLADIMRPSLRQEDFDTEKQVILEEILKYEDQPPFGAHEKCMAAYFGDHPLGNSVLGTTESVTGLTSHAMQEYFRLRYNPGNITLVATGCVDFDQLVADAQQRCGEWEAEATSRTTPLVTPKTGSHVLHKPTATQQYVVQISPGPAAEAPDRHAARVMATIFGDDTGSRLYWDLVDNGLAEYAGVGPYEFQNAGILMTYICCNPSDMETVLQRLHAAQELMEREGVTADELELARNKICSYLVRRGERPSSRLFSVGNAWLQRGTYQTMRERLAAYNRVTISDINEVLARYPLRQNTTMFVGPANRKIEA